MDVCKSGKVSYPTAKAAKQTVVHITQRSHHFKIPGKWGRGPLRAYHCQLCGQYHVGNSAQGKPSRPRPHFIDEEETA